MNKNIFLIPTDKPSRLVKNNLGVALLQNKPIEENVTNKILDLIEASFLNIYITNSEEIKEGDAYITKHGEICKSHNGSKILLFKTDKKIIFTDNKDLIADGVQEVSEDFLQWFINNSSCERVEVKSYYETLQDGLTFDRINYKIVIPKEESKPIWKQIIEDCGGEEAFMEAAGLKPRQYTSKELEGFEDFKRLIKQKQEEYKTNLERLPSPGLVKKLYEYFKNVPLVEEPKQETRKICKCKRAYENPLSEICSLCWNELYPNEKDEIKEDDLLKPKQEESFNYDEVRKIAYNAYCLGQLDNPNEGKFNKWIQQFKK